MNKYLLIYTSLIIFILFIYSYYKIFYIKTIKNPNDLLVLVNKKNKLSNNYIPNDLKTINIKYAYQNKQLREVAKINFEKLGFDAKKMGLNIIVVSAYRDYNYQKKLYNYYIEKNGKKYARRVSAKPGHSEHQTGLAIDVMGSNDDYNLFNESKEFEWMINNAYKYGFILRYPEDKEIITGFKYEPWHYRYVGKEVAKIIYEKRITLEEYFLFFK